MANSITALPEWREYFSAKNDLEQYRTKREEMERSISRLFSQYKAKKQQSEMADSLKEEKQLNHEAAELKQEAETAQQELDQYEAETPHYGNQRGTAWNELQDAASPAIEELHGSASDKISAACEILESLQAARGKLSHQRRRIIPSSVGVLDDLRRIDQRLQS